MKKDEFNQLVTDSGLNPVTLKRNKIGWDEWMEDNVISWRVDSRLVPKQRVALAIRYEGEARDKVRAAKALRGEDSVRELLADISHAIWAHWTKYQFSQCVELSDRMFDGIIDDPDQDGALVIPADKVARWTRQMNKPYSELTEKEKESDRHQADKILEVMFGEVNHG